MDWCSLAYLMCNLITGWVIGLLIAELIIPILTEKYINVHTDSDDDLLLQEDIDE